MSINGTKGERERREKGGKKKPNPTRQFLVNAVQSQKTLGNKGTVGKEKRGQYHCSLYDTGKEIKGGKETVALDPQTTKENMRETSWRTPKDIQKRGKTGER